MKLLIKMVIHRTYIEIILIPYHPKEPVIFPFIQQYNLIYLMTVIQIQTIK